MFFFSFYFLLPLRLCLNSSGTGEKGRGLITNKPLHYKNSIFHRVIKGFMAQGGDFENFNGTGGESIYGRTFNDENFIRRHNSRGLLSLANSGPNTNGSQFFITFKETPHLNGKHVVFGKLIDGFEVLDSIEDVPTNPDNKPYKEIRVVACGLLSATEEEETGKDTKASSISSTKQNDALSVLGIASEKSVQEQTSSMDIASQTAAKTLNIKKKTKSDSDSDSDDDTSHIFASALQKRPSSSSILKGEAAASAVGGWAPVDLESMTPLQRKMHELRSKMKQAHQRNRADARSELTLIHSGNLQHGRGEIKVDKDGEVASVTSRFNRGQNEADTSIESNSNDTTSEAKLSSRNVTGTDKARQKEMKMMQNSVLDCEEWSEKRAKKRHRDNGAENSLPYRGFTKRLETQMLAVKDTTPADASVVPDYKPTPAQMASLMEDLDDQIRRRDPMKKRKAHYEGKDIDYINENNKAFNEKVAKDYDKYTAEIKASIERGSAL